MEGTSGGLYPNLLLQAESTMRPEQVAEVFIQSCLENLQGWRQCNLSESYNPKPQRPAPSQVLDHIHHYLSTTAVLLLGGLHSWKQPILHPSPSLPLTVIPAPEAPRKPGPSVLAVWPPCTSLSLGTASDLSHPTFLQGSNPSLHRALPFQESPLNVAWGNTS